MSMRKQKSTFIFWAMGALGEGLSGGDRIFIELARRIYKKYPTNIYLWEEGFTMCQRQNLSESENLKFKIIRMNSWCRWGFLLCYISRIIFSIIKALKINIVASRQEKIVVYSTSEFWMDSLPALILKLRYPKIIWMAAWFQTAPNPLTGFAEGEREERFRLKAFLYWLVQLPIKPLIDRFADFVLINNTLEMKQFPKLAQGKKALVILGAVDLDKIREFKTLYPKPYTLNPKIYDAVFQGRFHPQKGVLELIDIWKMIVNKKLDAKLVMIGDGPLMKNVKIKIQKSKLENNIILTGYLFDGEEKYKIFSQSKIVVHPAFYDSGGMAAAEAMAFEIPCVGFNLESFKYYYPKGMIKVKIGDLEAFANKVIELLNNANLRNKLGKEALKMMQSSWSWDERAREVLDKIEEVI